jgi:hypothetical protein
MPEPHYLLGRDPKKLGNAIFKAAHRALLMAGLELQGEIQATLSHPGTGRVYLRGVKTRVVMGKNGKLNAFGRQVEAAGELRNVKNRSVPTAYGYHRASAPGEPPAVDTGRLRRSIKTVDDTKGKNVLIRVGSDVEYAPDLEYGSKARNLLPRPYMRPSLTRAKSKMDKTMRDETHSSKFVY